MTYEFQGSLYPNSGSMHRAIAEAWLTADGSHSIETQREFLRDSTDTELAIEAEEGWDLAGQTDEGWGVETFPKMPAYEREALIRAFADLRTEIG